MAAGLVVAFAAALVVASMVVSDSAVVWVAPTEVVTVTVVAVTAAVVERKAMAAVVMAKAAVVMAKAAAAMAMVTVAMAKLAVLKAEDCTLGPSHSRTWRCRRRRGGGATPTSPQFCRGLDLGDRLCRCRGLRQPHDHTCPRAPAKRTECPHTALSCRP